MATSEQECIDALREAARRLGESPTKAQYEDLGLRPASATIQRVMNGWNAAKDAAGLETSVSTGSRTLPKPDDVDLSDDESWAELSVYQRWHYRNREWNTERTLARRARLRTWLNEYKAESNGCRRCDVADPRCLDFHHEDPETKEMAVNEMVPMGYSQADIAAEVDRCVLLCANCHKKEHTANSPAEHPTTKADRLRAWASEEKREQGCRRCAASDPRVLQFHHVGEKRGGVGELIANSAPENVVRTEVEQCVVLCANCHRLEHWEPPATGDQSDSV